VVQTFKPVLLHVAAYPGGRRALVDAGIARCACSSLTRRRVGTDITGVSDRISWCHAWPEHMPSCEKPGEQPRHHFVSEVERFLGRRFLGPWECGHMHASGSSATTGNFEGEEARPWPIRPFAGPLDRWTAGPLDRWTAGPLDRWTAGPLDRWTAGPLDRWTAGPLAALGYSPPRRSGRIGSATACGSGRQRPRHRLVGLAALLWELRDSIARTNVLPHPRGSASFRLRFYAPIVNRI
jgi:hypothetical protein